MITTSSVALPYRAGGEYRAPAASMGQTNHRSAARLRNANGNGDRLADFRAPELRIAGAIATIVVAVRLGMTRSLDYCGTPDACYYLGMAQNLAAGRGFHAHFLYDFQQTHPTLPNTGIEYWRPGISLLLAASRAFGGATLHGSIAITTLAGVLFAAAAWHIAMQSYGDRRLALEAFLLCLVGPACWVGSISPDSTLYYGAAVAWFLALFTVKRQGLWQDLLAVGCVGAAYLIRNDAALLLLPLLAVLHQRYRRARRTGRSARGASLPYAAAMLAAFLLALAPMHLLYRAVLGAAFPSETAQTLFLNDLGDFEWYRKPVSLRTLLAPGIKHLLIFRITTLVTVLYRTAALTIGYAALVLLPGLFGRTAPGTTVEGASDDVAAQQHLPELVGASVFFVAPLLIYSFVLPAVGGFAALRTTAALMPFVAVLVVVAIRRMARSPPLAAMLTGAVIAVNALSGVMEVRRDTAMMNTVGSADRAESAQLQAMGADRRTAVVLTGDPVQFSVTTGYATVALPSNGLDAIAEAAKDFRATHVMLNTEDLPATLPDLNLHLRPVNSAELPGQHTLVLALPANSGEN